ncbi:MAG: putative sodium/calcium exchanger membrane region [Leptospirillum sp. Group IV 'UBA BS']|nr:MAG: putative sodium/calcium exchanger membrane region [Leptospirillum sp. Group IV 'UBA BS']MCL5284608.1 hypothetical protein [Nitrospirota bacterium]
MTFLPAGATLTTGFFLIVAGSALFTRSLEATVERFFENRNRGLRILGNISLSLPELILPLIAFLTPGAGRSLIEAGTGALFGPPLFLSLFLVPLAFFLGRAQARSLFREIPFLAAGLAAALLLFGRSLPLRALLALALGALYLWGLLSSPDHEDSTGAGDSPARWSMKDGLSVGGGALLMGLGSHLFLSGIAGLQEASGLSSFWTALLLGPIATEAPELLTLTHFLRKRSLTQSFVLLWGSIHLQVTLSIAAGLLISTWTGSSDALHAGLALLGALTLLFGLALRKGGMTGKSTP